MNPKLPRDTSAWLDQVEQARHALILTMRSGQQTKASDSLSEIVDHAIQRFMDQVIDEASR